MFKTVRNHALAAVGLYKAGSYLNYFLGHYLDVNLGSTYLYLSGLCCFVYLSYQLGSYVDYVMPRTRVDPGRKAVFITGCDRGFGRMLARRLDNFGFKVFAGCLDPTGPDAQELLTGAGSLELVPIDVTKEDSVLEAARKVWKELKKTNFDLWALVNNAGVIERGELEWFPMEKIQQQFDVNTFGVVRVTQAFLPLLRKHEGRVVTVCSIGGRQTFSGFAPYCMSKHAVISYCDGLRLEMKKFGVKVVTIEPFSYRTDMTDLPTMLRSIEDTMQRMRSKPLVYDMVHTDFSYYGDYMHHFARSVERFNAATRLPDPESAVDAMVEGVCAVSPHYSYVPGDTKSLLNLWLSRRAPKTLVDYYIRKKVTFDCDVQEFVDRDRPGWFKKTRVIGPLCSF